MRKAFQKLLSYWALVTLIVLVIVIGVTNYQVGTLLTGWDNIHPEFNFSLNISRSIFSAWQEYQSLGLPAGTGYASDLPRQIFLGLLSFILPLSFLRYFYHLLALFLGALGVYILLSSLIFESLEKRKKQIVGFVGAIFYLFNLATLQMFYDPFEPVSHHFAALPWIFYVTNRYIKRKDKKSLLYLLLIAIFSIPQAYVTTYFLVTIILMTIFFVIIFIQTKPWKQILVCYLIFFAINAFWLFPNLYYLSFKTNTTTDSHINQMSTEDNFLQNKKYGNVNNTALLKGFWFQNVENTTNATTTYQLKDWISYMNTPVVYSIGYTLFGICMMGAVLAIWKREKSVLFFLPILIFSFIILSNDTPILSQIGSLFYKIPLFAQVFRFPFTKFSIAIAFCLSIFYATSFALLTVQDRFKKYTILLLIIFTILPVLFLIPIFKGDFFDKRNRLEIPQSYFQTMEFFKNQDPNTRIANFPQFSFWGWTYYNWGYRGSGFLWYGIKQPILDRTFDVWSKYSENYYYEISYAIYSGDLKLFENVLEKYQINWLLVDDAIMSFGSQKQIYNDNFKQFIRVSKKLKFEKTFDTITIYSVNLQSKPDKYIYAKENLPEVYPSYNWNNNDQAFVDLGDYVSLSNNPKGNQTKDLFFYPFRSLYSGRKQEELEFKVLDQGDYLLFSSDIPPGITFDSVYIPEFKEEEVTEIDEKNFSSKVKLPTIYIDGRLYDGNLSIKGKKLEVRVPKIKGYYSYHSNNNDILNFQSNPCNEYNESEYNFQPIKDQQNILLRLKSKSSSNCVNLDLPKLTHQLSYLLTIKSRNVTGKSLLFSLTNHNTQRLDIETYLPKNPNITDSTFVIPPMQEHGIGYSINLDNISYGRVETINDLGTFEIYPIPYQFLTALKLVKNEVSNNPEVRFYIEDVKHPNPSFYQVELSTNKLNTQRNLTLILSQSFDPGWQAFYFKDIFHIQRIPEHVLINNWANGWKVSKAGTIYIIFLPQLLEFLGFGILGLVIILILLRKISNTRVD